MGGTFNLCVGTGENRGFTCGVIGVTNVRVALMLSERLGFSPLQN